MKNHAKFYKFLLLSFFVLGIASIDAQSQTKKISIQGFLKDGNSKAVDNGPYELTFKLYTVASGGTAIWTETNAAVNVYGGVYSVQLGAINPISTIAFDVPYFLGVTIQGAELTPRMELTYAPYALAVDHANTVTCSGAVGDVKYSILNPTQFAQKNGTCWVPMDGRSMAGSELATIIGGSSVPNGSGLFLRGQEFPNSLDNDATRDSNSPIGQLEDQAMQKHEHDFIGATNFNNATPYLSVKFLNDIFYGYPQDLPNNGINRPIEESHGAPDNYMTFNTLDLRGTHNHTFSGITDNYKNSSVNETRPKNLNFWTYIRIN
jgi:hypothetical protein